MPGRLMLAGLLGFLTLLSGCHVTIRATDSGPTAPVERVHTQQPDGQDEQMYVLTALGAEMAREKFPRQIVVYGNFLGPEDKNDGPRAARFQPMRPVEPAIMSYALAAGALVDISPLATKRWIEAYFSGPGRDEVSPGEIEQPVAIFRQLLDPPVIRGDSAFVDVWETVLRAGRPDQQLMERWHYTLRRQDASSPWIKSGRVITWAQ